MRRCGGVCPEYVRRHGGVRLAPHLGGVGQLEDAAAHLPGAHNPADVAKEVSEFVVVQLCKVDYLRFIRKAFRVRSRNSKNFTGATSRFFYYLEILRVAARKAFD